MQDISGLQLVMGKIPKARQSRSKFMAVSKFPNIAKLIKSSRLKLGVSQTFLAANIDAKGGQFVSNIERGLCSIPEPKVKAVAKVLNISEEAIINAMVEDYREQLKAEI